MIVTKGLAQANVRTDLWSKNVLNVTNDIEIRHTLSIALSGQQTMSCFRSKRAKGSNKTCRPRARARVRAYGAFEMADGPLEAGAVATGPQSTDSKLPKEQVVDPWNVSAAEGEDNIDYDKLISQCALLYLDCDIFFMRSSEKNQSV